MVEKNPNILLIKEFHSPFDDLLRVFSNRSLLHYTDLNFCNSFPNEYVESWISDADRISFAGFTNTQFVGFVSAHLVRKHLTASITIVVLEEFQHTGYAKQLLTYIVAYLQKQGIARIEAQICTENTISVALFEGLGFECEGILHKNFLIDGELRDSYMYALY